MNPWTTRKSTFMPTLNLRKRRPPKRSRSEAGLDGFVHQINSWPSCKPSDNQTRDGLRRPVRVSGDVALRINQAVKFRRLGGINRDSDQVGAGRDGDGAPIVRVPADAVGKVVGLRQQTPAYVIRRPGQGEICQI